MPPTPPAPTPAWPDAVRRRTATRSAVVWEPRSRSWAETVRQGWRWVTQWRSSTWWEPVTRWWTETVWEPVTEWVREAYHVAYTAYRAAERWVKRTVTEAVQVAYTAYRTAERWLTKTVLEPVQVPYTAYRERTRVVEREVEEAVRVPVTTWRTVVVDEPDPPAPAAGPDLSAEERRRWERSQRPPSGATPAAAPGVKSLADKVKPPKADEPPWWAPLATAAGAAWEAYDRSVNAPIYDAAETWRGNIENGLKIAGYGLGQLWFKHFDPYAQLWPNLQTIWNKKLSAVQSPGLPADGPLTPGLQAMAALDGAGAPVSPVGADVARLIDGRGGVRVGFVDTGGAGVAPWQGRILLPNNYLGNGQAVSPYDVGLVEHELTHVLERDLNDPAYWPSGYRPSAARGTAEDIGEWLMFSAGESTNYMEVLSYIVGEAVEYDRIQFILAANPPTDPARVAALQRRAGEIEDHLATYTAGDPLNAIRYMIEVTTEATDPDRYKVYRANYVNELGIPDHRIPQGAWADHLPQMGFSEAAIQEIEAIAARGTAEFVDPSQVSPQTGEYSTPTSTPAATAAPTPTPTPTPAPTPTPTAGPSPSP